jgi:hypothetical protein
MPTQSFPPGPFGQHGRYSSVRFHTHRMHPRKRPKALGFGLRHPVHHDTRNPVARERVQAHASPTHCQRQRQLNWRNSKKSRSGKTQWMRQRCSWVRQFAKRWGLGNCRSSIMPQRGKRKWVTGWLDISRANPENMAVIVFDVWVVLYPEKEQRIVEVWKRSSRTLT